MNMYTYICFTHLPDVATVPMSSARRASRHRSVFGVAAAGPVVGPAAGGAPQTKTAPRSVRKTVASPEAEISETGPCRGAKDVKRSTPTQQPTIPWSSLVRQRTRQCSTLQLTQQGRANYQELSCSLSGGIGMVVCCCDCEYSD